MLCGTLANAATQAEAEAALAAPIGPRLRQAISNRGSHGSRTQDGTGRDATAGDFDAALAAAQRAEALARQSVEQSHEQDKLWSDAVIK